MRRDGILPAVEREDRSEPPGLQEGIDPRREAPPDVARGQGGAPTHNADRVGVESEDRVGNFAAAGTDESRQAEDFARPKCEVDAPEFSGRFEPGNSENLGTQRPGHMVGVVRLHVAPDHLMNELLRIGIRHPARGDVASVAEHGDAVAQAEDFIHPMRDVENGNALARR